MEQPIQFNRVRDFGQLVNDSIGFVKQHFKPLFTPLVYIGLFFILAAIATGMLVQIKAIDLYGTAHSGMFTGLNDGTDITAIFGINYALYFLFYFLSFTVVQLVTLCYIHLYKTEGQVAPTKEAVWELFKSHALRFLFVSLLLFVLQMIALAFCILPGIYFFPIASLIYVMVVMDDASFEQAFNRAFSLIKDNWWKTFGALSIVWLMAYMTVGLVALPGTILTMSGFFLGESPGLSLAGATISVIVQSFGMLIYALPTITAVLCYYSLSEEKEGTGLMDRIEKLGSGNPDKGHHPDEAY